MQEKPKVEQIVWIFQKLREHLDSGGSFRDLIYEAMGLGPEAYEPLCEAGGKDIADALDWVHRMTELDVEIEMDEDEGGDGSN